jgi:hypothetical protein
MSSRVRSGKSEMISSSGMSDARYEHIEDRDAQAADGWLAASLGWFYRDDVLVVHDRGNLGVSNDSILE